jgi:hypothetical protein
LPPAIDQEIRNAITAHHKKFVVLIDPASRSLTIGLSDGETVEGLLVCELD